MKKHLLSIFILAIASLFYAPNCLVAGTFTQTPVLNIVPINIKDSPIEILKIDFIEGNCCQIILENKGEKEIDGGILKGIIFSKDEKIIGGFAKIISLNLREKAQQKIIIDWNKIIQANANNKIILFPFKIFFKMYNEEGEPINDIVYWQLRKELLRQVGANKDVNLLGDLKSKKEADSEPQKPPFEWCRELSAADCGNPMINKTCRSMSACVSSFQCQDTTGYCYYTCKPSEQCC